ncbi:MAG: hypothetical protein QOG64_1311 [Acidimicrobiaceae bacterium]|nr:hypothetical protein [Acidimicrobiaceae bacterium]
MRLTASAPLSAAPEAAYGALADLGTYPGWLGIVRSAVPVAAVAGETGPAWSVDLGARVGPLWKTKRVRMVRVEARVPKLVRFERVEHDGRSHSPWVLTGEVEVDERGTLVTVDLFYGGNRWLPLADRLLRDEVAKAGARLEAHLAKSG